MPGCFPIIAGAKILLLKAGRTEIRLSEKGFAHSAARAIAQRQERETIPLRRRLADESAFFHFPKWKP